ncbi:flagellar basal body rod protein FlgB [bacterium]|nr:flagellar basal body rod protein FlgB [bacterium]
MLSIFSDKPYLFLKKILDLGTEKHRLIANNIANVNTPGYKTKELVFGEELKKALSDPDGVEELAGLKGKILEPQANIVRRDGNDVDLNKELSAMSKNVILQKLYMQVMRRRFNALREAMKGLQ